MQDSSSSDNPDTKEGKEHRSLLCQKCLNMAKFLRDWEGETACTGISLNCQISCSRGWLRYCHWNPLWDFNTSRFNTWWLRTETGLCRLRAARHRYCLQLPVCCSPLCSKHWSTREVMLSAAPLRTRWINHLPVIRRCL